MWHENYVARQDEFVAQQKLLPYDLSRDIVSMLAAYPFWLATKYDLSKYDIKIISLSYFNIDRPDTFQYSL